MVRGTFANIRLKNRLVPGTEGGVTAHQPSGERLSIFDAAERYRAEGVPLVVVAGRDYGMGSSRDWAAKGTRMLGVRAVLAQSFERIHRSNLVGMGVLPLVFDEGRGAATYGLDGTEAITIDADPGALQVHERVTVRARKADGRVIEMPATARLDTPVDVECYRQGGILPMVLRQLLGEEE
jgi:aconitate hydratase